MFVMFVMFMMFYVLFHFYDVLVFFFQKVTANDEIFFDCFNEKQILNICVKHKTLAICVVHVFYERLYAVLYWYVLFSVVGVRLDCVSLMVV
jgi:hypothetical protein